MTPEEKRAALARCNDVCKRNLMEMLSIEFTEVGDDYLTAKMPVNSKTHQADGVLHGGATAALAETVGSIASVVFLNNDKATVRGIEISMNHIGSVARGMVFATAKKVHLGRTTQVWEMRVSDEAGKLIAYGKHTTIALYAQK